MENRKEEVSKLLKGMKETKADVNRISVKVDTNDADYSITETKISEDDELMHIDGAILLATLYKGMHGLDDYFYRRENTILTRISESEEQRQQYETIVGDLLMDYVDFSEGHTLEKVELFYDNKRYVIVSAKDEVIKSIMERWVKKDEANAEYYALFKKETLLDDTVEKLS